MLISQTINCSSNNLQTRVKIPQTYDRSEHDVKLVVLTERHDSIENELQTAISGHHSI